MLMFLILEGGYIHKQVALEVFLGSSSLESQAERLVWSVDNCLASNWLSYKKFSKSFMFLAPICVFCLFQKLFCPRKPKVAGVGAAGAKPW